MEEITNYRKQLMEMQIKLNNKDRLNLEQRNIVLEKQIRIEQLEQELHDIKKKHVEPHQEFLNANIKMEQPMVIQQSLHPITPSFTSMESKRNDEFLLEKKECGECRREDRRMYSTPGYKCENDFCCYYK
jgi:hypothetical protein